MRSVNCNLCSNNNFSVYLKVKGDRLVKCKECGLIYLNPRPTYWELRNMYTEHYKEKIPSQIKEIEREINKRKKRCEKVLKMTGKKKGRILDIGCGFGYFLACMKKYGWDTTGIDINEKVIKFAKQRLKLNVLRRSIVTFRPQKRFDAIMMFHSLEHMPNPVRTLRKISKMLFNKGMLIVGGPNFNSFDRIWHKSDWRGYTNSHLYYFTPKTYRLVLEKAGFVVQKIEYEHWNLTQHIQEINLKYMEGVIKKLEKPFLDKVIKKCLKPKGRDLILYAKKV